MTNIKRSLYQKSCCVPSCTNTTVNAPIKLFFEVPSESKRRDKWLIVGIGFNKEFLKYSHRSNLFVCEDHFNVSHISLDFFVILVKFLVM